MIKLRDFMETQNQGVRQNPYKYKIVDILNVYDVGGKDDSTDLDIKCARDGVLYSKAEAIPKELYDRSVVYVEPGMHETYKYLYLKIVII